MNHSTPGLPVHHQLPEFTQTHVHRVSDAIQTSHLLPSPSFLPSIFPSIRVFSKESVLRIRWPKYWEFQLYISPSNEYSGFNYYSLLNMTMPYLSHYVIIGQSVQFSSVTQSCQLFVTHGLQQRQASLSITNSRSLLKLMSIESVMPSNHLVLCHPPLLLPSIFPSSLF